MIRFGPAGNSDLFYDSGGKSTYEAPKWAADMGLTAFEYSFGHGARLIEKTGKKIKDEAEKYGIAFSVHAPYYINLAADGQEKFEKNLGYLRDSAQKGAYMGADRVVFHPGSAKGNAKEAFDSVYKNIKEIIKILKAEGFGDMIFCPETMGKFSQVGDVEEVARLCGISDNIYPALDFAHIHARSQGGLRSKEDFLAVAEFMENIAGREKTRDMHVHFSKIEFTAAGEKKHRKFADEGFGPDFLPFADVIIEKELRPRIICESRGTQDIDAKEMLRIYNERRAKG